MMLSFKMKNDPKRIDLLNKLTIGIATYNDWDALKTTLSKLVEQGLANVKTIIFDDGSTEKIDFDLSVFPMPIVFKRFEQSQGSPAQRNNLAAATTTEYLLSIDDDSYPVNGDICSVIAEMEKDQDLVVMALDIRGPEDSVEVAPEVSTPTDIRYFVNCGALFRVDYFNATGGFQNPDDLGWIYNEELDFSIRCWRDGKRIKLDKRFVIVHDRELKDGEDPYKATCYARGIGYLYGRYFRGTFGLYKMLKMPFMFYRSPRTHAIWLKSIVSFAKCYSAGKRDRSLDTRSFASKDQWNWDKLELPPFA